MAHDSPLIPLSRNRESHRLPASADRRSRATLHRVAAAVLLCCIVLIMPGTASDVAGRSIGGIHHMTITMANHAPIRFDEFGNQSYYVKFDGGGVNALHLTTDPSEPYGQVTTTTARSGVLYFADTGGRGFDDNLILMVAVNGTIPDDFRFTVRTSGYRWEPTPVLNQPPSRADIAYVAGAVDDTFTAADFFYAPQTAKPGKPDLPVYYGQDVSDSANGFRMLFVDLGVGALGRNSGLSDLTDNGAVKIEYSFENLDSFAAFNAYAWCNQSNQGRGISWTNDLTGESASGCSGFSVVGSGLPAGANGSEFSAVPASMAESTRTFPESAPEAPLSLYGTAAALGIVLAACRRRRPEQEVMQNQLTNLK